MVYGELRARFRVRLWFDRAEKTWQRKQHHYLNQGLEKSTPIFNVFLYILRIDYTINGSITLLE